MFLKMFTVFDSKAAAFLQPFFAPTTAVAIRSFSQAARTQGHDFNQYAEDYTLFELGEFDQETAKIMLRDTPTSICLASTVLASEQE